MATPTRKKRKQVAPAYERADLDLLLSIARRYTRYLEDNKIERPKNMQGAVNLMGNVVGTLANVHSKEPINLHRLAEFDDFNFIHDVTGIMRHADYTGELLDCFEPRCGRRPRG